MPRSFELPPAPAGHTGRVQAWSEPVVIPTYEPLRRTVTRCSWRNGSTRAAAVASTRCVHGPHRRQEDGPCLGSPAPENEFLRLMVLRRSAVAFTWTGQDQWLRLLLPPERDQAGAGRARRPWISGGVEFNWPQHHRPATFMPVRTCIEEGADGSRTVWCGDHDPLNRLKGMHGVCLYPGRPSWN